MVKKLFVVGLRDNDFEEQLNTFDLYYPGDLPTNGQSP